MTDTRQRKSYEAIIMQLVQYECMSAKALYVATGLHRNTVNVNLRRLQKMGVVTPTYGGGVRGNPNMWALTPNWKDCYEL